MNPTTSYPTSTTPAIVNQFWIRLEPTTKRATCPKCGVLSEVRQARNGRRVETYVFHCDSPRRVFLGNSQMSRVVRQLAQDARAAAEAVDPAEAADVHPSARPDVGAMLEDLGGR